MDIERLLVDPARRPDASAIQRFFELGAKLRDPVNLAIGQPHFPVPDAMKRAACDAIERALNQVLTTRVETLDEPRSVGRAGLPSTVRGLLFHAAEHAQRHAGQIATTAKIVCSSRGRP